jgi:hypothetical protein
MRQAMDIRKSVRRKRTEGTKIKIGTILDSGVVEKLKLRAVRDNKPISLIIEEAVLRYDDVDSHERALRVRALESVLALRFNISGDDLRLVMQEDYYNQ